MGPFYLTLIFAFSTILTFGQTTKHLSFNVVPIDGTLDKYITIMEQNGFTHIGT